MPLSSVIEGLSRGQGQTYSDGQLDNSQLYLLLMMFIIMNICISFINEY